MTKDQIKYAENLALLPSSFGYFYIVLNLWLSHFFFKIFGFRLAFQVWFLVHLHGYLMKSVQGWISPWLNNCVETAIGVQKSKFFHSETKLRRGKGVTWIIEYYGFSLMFSSVKIYWSAIFIVNYVMSKHIKYEGKYCCFIVFFFRVSELYWTIF